MEEQREVVRHSNRPLAVVMLLGAVAVLGFLLFSADRRADNAQEPTPTSGSATSTSVTALTNNTPATSSTTIPASTFPAAATPRVVEDLAIGAGTVEQRDLGDGRTLLWWSYREELVGQAPGVALVNAEGQVLWENEGRANSSWQSAESNTRGQSSRTFFVEDVVVKADVGGEQDSFGRLVAFDMSTGSRLWVSQFQVPIEPTPRGATVSIHLRSGATVLLTRTVGLGLARVSPLTGSPMWSADVPAGPVAGSFRRSDGSEVIAVSTEFDNLFLDVDTGDLEPLSGS